MMNETKKRCVLVIDDDSLNRKLLRTVLQLEGNYIVQESSDAVEGFKRANEFRPDVILMDIRMPGIDGLLATQIIKKESTLKDIPIVAVSSNAMEGDKEKAIEAGCSGYITKPINVRNFIDIMEQFIQNDLA